MVMTTAAASQASSLTRRRLPAARAAPATPRATAAGVISSAVAPVMDRNAPTTTIAAMPTPGTSAPGRSASNSSLTERPAPVARRPSTAGSTSQATRSVTGACASEPQLVRVLVPVLALLVEHLLDVLAGLGEADLVHPHRRPAPAVGV